MYPPTPDPTPTPKSLGTLSSQTAAAAAAASAAAAAAVTACQTQAAKIVSAQHYIPSAVSHGQRPWTAYCLAVVGMRTLRR